MERGRGDLPAGGFPFSVDQLFWLVATPNLFGSVTRVPYTAAVARLAGRNWTPLSGALLLVPIALMLYCVTNPATPYWLFLLAAAPTGLGGGNFASSMAKGPDPCVARSGRPASAAARRTTVLRRRAAAPVRRRRAASTGPPWRCQCC